MAKYQVRMLDSVTGAEGSYSFEHRDDLISKPADEVVAAFFDYADREVFNRKHLEYELNGVIKNKKLATVVAVGSLHTGPDEDDLQPFTIFISRTGK